MVKINLKSNKKAAKNGNNSKNGNVDSTKKRQPASKGVSDAKMNSYALALSSPFASQAIGAQVPDMYSFPTATYHATGTVTVTSNASGVASVMLLAHPTLGLIDMTGCVSSSSMTQYAATTSCYASVSQANLDAALSNFRTVGAGWEVRNLQPPTTATGRLICVPVPVSGPIVGPRTLENIACANSYVCEIATGVSSNLFSSTAGLPSSLLAFPMAQEITMQDIISQELGFQSRPVTASAFDFHACSNQFAISSTYALAGGAPILTATGAVNAANDSIALQNNSGWTAYALRFEGCPVSSTIAEIKYMLHLEGSPAQAAGSTGILAPGTGMVQHVNPSGHISVLSKVLNLPPIQLAIKAVGALGDSYVPGISGVASMVLSKLGLTF